MLCLVSNMGLQDAIGILLGGQILVLVTDIVFEICSEVV